MPEAEPAVGFVTDPLSLEHDHQRHPERAERLTAILDHLDRSGLRGRMVELSSRDATDEEVLAVHAPGLLDALDEIAAGGGGMLDADTYVTPASPAVARRAAGATLAALAAVLSGEVRSAFAAVRPPGHHATQGVGTTAKSGSADPVGFCLLNNVAIAAAMALREGLERVAIVDWDVHHGNGTQAIFDADPRVLYVSTHAWGDAINGPASFYPRTGHYSNVGVGEAAGTKVNIPLPLGAGDRAFVAAYERVVLPALQHFRPQLMLVSSGWDAHVRDQLGPLNVTTQGYTQAMRLVLEAAEALCAGHVVVALEGGYDSHALRWCAGALCGLMLGDEPEPDPEPVDPPGDEPNVGELLESVRHAAGLD